MIIIDNHDIFSWRLLTRFIGRAIVTTDKIVGVQLTQLRNGGEVMTGIPLFDAVFDFINLGKMLAGMVFGACVVFFASVVIGLLAPNTSWGLFVDRYITGYWRPQGHSPLRIGFVLLLVSLVVWSVFSWIGSQTLPRFP
jgi:hypothetical protein